MTASELAHIQSMPIPLQYIFTELAKHSLDGYDEAEGPFVMRNAATTYSFADWSSKGKGTGPHSGDQCGRCRCCRANDAANAAMVAMATREGEGSRRSRQSHE